MFKCINDHHSSQSIVKCYPLRTIKKATVNVKYNYYIESYLQLMLLELLRP